MTTYLGVFNRRQFYQKGEVSRYRYQAAAIKTQHGSVFRLNLILLLASVFAVIAYIFASNLLVAQKYAFSLRKSELSQLNAKPMAEGSKNGDLEALFRFARNSGLVEAKDIDSILEKDSLAIFNQ